MPVLERNPAGSTSGSDFLVGERRVDSSSAAASGGCSWAEEQHLNFHRRCCYSRVLERRLPKDGREAVFRREEELGRWMREEGTVASGREVVQRRKTRNGDEARMKDCSSSSPTLSPSHRRFLISWVGFAVESAFLDF